MIMPMRQLGVDQEGRIRAVTAGGELGRRIRDMGLVPGTRIKVIGREEDNLFHMRTNLRYGCNILRHYLDIEQGNLFRALGRYNGSLGKPHYPNLVRAAWEKHWHWAPQQLAAAPQPHSDETASH